MSEQQESEPDGLEDISRVGDLEISQDKDFERHEWRAERIGWGIFSLIVFAALLGVFSSGPLSGATAGSAQAGVTLKYDRFARKMAPTMLEVTLHPREKGRETVRLRLSRRYLDQFEVMRITPEPARTVAAGESLIYEFATTDTAEKTGVTFHLRPERAGKFSAHIGLAEGASIRFHHYIYP